MTGTARSHRTPGARARFGRAAGFLFAIAFVAVWQLVTEIVKFQYLPPPSQIAGSVPDLLRNTRFGSDLLHTVQVCLTGWVLAGGAGIGLGTALGLSRSARAWSGTSIEALRAIPGITLLPVAMLIFGLSSSMEIAIVSYVAFWPVLISTISGIRGIPRLRYDVARTLHLSTRTLVRSIVIPSAATSTLVGLRLSLSFALVLAVVAEMVGNPAGLGYLLIIEQQALRPTLMFLCIISIGMLGIVLNWLFGLIARRIYPGAMTG